MTKWLNSLVTVALIANIKVFAADYSKDNHQFEESGSDVGIEDFNSRQIHVDKPKDQGIITEEERKEKTKQYLKELDELANKNCSKVREYNDYWHNEGNNSKLIVTQNTRSIWQGDYKDFCLDDKVVPAPCALDEETVNAYLTDGDATWENGYEKLQYLSLENALILGNAIGKFVDTFTKTITHYNNTTPAENMKDSKYTMSEKTRKLLEKMHNAKTKEVLQASEDDLWEFIEKGGEKCEKGISQLSNIIIPDEGSD